MKRKKRRNFWNNMGLKLYLDLNWLFPMKMNLGFHAYSTTQDPNCDKFLLLEKLREAAEKLTFSKHLEITSELRDRINFFYDDNLKPIGPETKFNIGLVGVRGERIKHAVIGDIS